MRWLIIGFLFSLGALLLAVAGMARHVRNHRARPGGKTQPLDSAHESDAGPEP
jgi:hypothetical protein